MWYSKRVTLHSPHCDKVFFLTFFDRIIRVAPQYVFLCTSVEIERYGGTCSQLVCTHFTKKSWMIGKYRQE